MLLIAVLSLFLWNNIGLASSQGNILDGNINNNSNYFYALEIVYSVIGFVQGNVRLTNETQCERDLRRYFEALANKSYPWALKMFDASTKVPRGLLVGHVVDLGNYDECISISAPATDGKAGFIGQHCMVEFALDSLNNGVSTSMQGPTCRQQMEWLDDPLKIKKFCTALCIPSSCSSAQLQSLVQTHLNYSKFQNTHVKIEESLCNTREVEDVPPAEWLVIVIIAVFIALVVASTAYDVVVTESKNGLYKSFSAFTNGKQFVSVKKSDDMIGVLLGMRFISMGWIILGQRYYWNNVGPSVNPLFVSDLLQEWGTMHIINHTLAADTFLLISGTLVTYRFMQHMSNNTFSLVHFYIHRLIRLSPAYFAVLMVQATFMDYSAYGPFWRLETAASREGCHYYWWTNVLYINNYVHTDTQCLDQSWYLAVDCQLFLLSPIMLYILWKLPKKYSYSIAGILILAGISATFAIAYENKIPVSDLALRENADMLRYLYYPTHTRFTSWLIGIILGHILYNTHGKEVKLHAVILLLGTVIATVLTMGLVLGMTPFLESGYEYDQVGDSMFYAFFRPGWALGVAWIIFVCDAGFGGLPNMLLSWHIFLPLSRMVYGMFLVHSSLFSLREKSLKNETYVADSISIPQFMGDMIFSMAIGAILYILFETPPLKIEEALRKRGLETNKNDHVILDGVSNGDVHEESSSLNRSQTLEGLNT